MKTVGNDHVFSHSPDSVSESHYGIRHELELVFKNRILTCQFFLTGTQGSVLLIVGRLGAVRVATLEVMLPKL